jgi:hypothetical protein
MLLAHGPIAYMLNGRIQKKSISKLRRRDQILIAFFALFFGILPDFDYFILLNSDIPTFQHHLYYFHSLVFWIPLWVLFYLSTILIGRYLESSHRKIFTKDFLNILSLTFFISTFSHLLADLFVSYNALLYPLPTQMSVLGSIFHINFFTGYLFSVQFGIELIILTVFLALILKEFFRKTLLSKYVKYLLLPITILYLVFVIFMNLNTYNQTFELRNGSIMYDEDFDSVLDSKDIDSNNNGLNNLEDVEIGLVKDNAKRILNEGGYTDSIPLFRYWGGLNSYRLVSQSFFEVNKSIEPVLNDYYRKVSGDYNYSPDFMYEDYLFNYLMENRSSEFYIDGIDISSFDLFFVVDNGEVKNLGIIFDSGEVGTVLDSDIRTKIHTIEDVLSSYEGKEIYLIKY